MSELNDINSISNKLRCPNCKIGKIHLDLQSTFWAYCGNCSYTFEYFDGIPFLCNEDIKRIADEDQRTNNNGFESMMIDKQSIKRANIVYHNKYAELYEHDASTRPIFKEGSNCQVRIEGILRQAKKTSEGVFLLDVCCGTGNILTRAKKHFDTVIGIDISVSMLKIAKSRQVSVLGADASNIPFVDECADCVTGFSALHHLYDYISVVKEMARILKPGGVLYTDWDPNRHTALQGWAVVLAVKMELFRRKIMTKNHIPNDFLQDLAEFHHTIGHGYDIEKVKETLIKEGFRSVRAIYHVNPPSFEKKYYSFAGSLLRILKLVSFIPPKDKNVLPWTAIVAIK